MRRGTQGQYVTISTVEEKVRAFVPNSLPPVPPVQWSSKLRTLFDQALLALGKLDSVTEILPDTALFLYTYVRQEAVLSSMIEGTKSSLSDLLVYEMDEQSGVPFDDVREVSNYVAALYHGLGLLKDGLPLSSRLLRQVHGVLLSKGRCSSKQPGEFRKSQNWIGGTRPGNAAFVPPPADKVAECMGQLEKFLHDQPEPTPVLLKAALAHAQFETIHPFLDGNGRLGRLLISLILCDQRVLREPILYLSLYFKTHRQQYYDLLNGIRTTGDWEAWLEFFAEAVHFTASRAVETARSLHKLVTNDREKIRKAGRSATSIISVHQGLIERPIASAGLLSQKTGFSPATVNKALNRLAEMGIVEEITSRKRSRLYSYKEYIRMMAEGTSD